MSFEENNDTQKTIKISNHVIDDYRTNPNLLYKPIRPPLARSIKDLTNYSRLPHIESAIKIRLYLQSVIKLYENGTVCWSDGDLERAYIYYLKMSMLFLEELPKKHSRFYDVGESRPGFKAIDLSALRLKAKQKCSEALKNMEIIKPKLIEYYKNLPQVEKKLDIITLQKKTSEHTGLSMEVVSNFIPGTQEELDKILSLKPILLPRSILDTFLEFFEANTTRGIESCALISGVYLKDNRVQVTHLLIPKQQGTYTTCSSLDEEQILTYHTEFNLMPLGWIHTHPEFDCFLSSIDLHMQMGYQLIMPEAVAIVLAPKREKSQGIFNLTKNGMNVLKNCDKGTTFHPHLENDLYKEAEHVQFVDSDDFQLVDLQKDYR